MSSVPSPPLRDRPTLRIDLWERHGTQQRLPVMCPFSNETYTLGGSYRTTMLVTYKGFDAATPGQPFFDTRRLPRLVAGGRDARPAPDQAACHAAQGAAQGSSAARGVAGPGGRDGWG